MTEALVPKNKTEKTPLLGDIHLVVERNGEGEIISLHGSHGLKRFDFQKIDTQLIHKSDEIQVQIETVPPGALERKRSGHSEIPSDSQFWVVSCDTPDFGRSTTLPRVLTNKTKNIKFTTTEQKNNASTFLPFTFNVQHPSLSDTKNEILIVSQIFGHVSWAAKLIQGLPIELQKMSHVAAKNTDNVPRVIEHMKTMGIFHEKLMSPLVYDDAASGGQNILDRNRALWWLIQNPEVVNQWLHSKVIISDCREETAWLKDIADKLNLPQIFLSLTYVWPQNLNHVENLPEPIQSAFNNIPDLNTKLEAMHRMGLNPSDAVPDWFDWAKKWKAGVRDNTSLAADAVISFSLVSPFERKPMIDNCIVFPPRALPQLEEHLEPIEWAKDKKRIVVVAGAGDWTERETFFKLLVDTAPLISECHFKVVGPSTVVQKSLLPENIEFLGFIDPGQVDMIIASAHMAIIKPAHFSIENTAGLVTLIGPTDTLQKCISPRDVAITVEVDEERLCAAVESWFAMGKPNTISPLIDCTSSETAADSIRNALNNLESLQQRAQKIPRNGIELFTRVITSLAHSNFQRSQVLSIVQQLQQTIHEQWIPKQEKL